MSIWQHLFTRDMEYPAASDVLAGLELKDVGVRPDGMLHSLYEELFHTLQWQSSMVKHAEGGAAVVPVNHGWPASPMPDSDDEWKELVEAFLAGSEAARALGEESERLEDVLPGGQTRRERLELLAVHNAYHFGKMVALRQMLGIWPSPQVRHET